MGTAANVAQWTFQGILAFSLPIGLAIAAFGSALGLGKAVVAAMEATARQPEAAGAIRMSMLIGCAFIEALTIYSLLAVLLMMGKIS